MAVRIRVLDHVSQCYTADDGLVLRSVLLRHLATGEQCVVAFDGVRDVTSSFVNAALVSLLDDYSFDTIRRRISFSGASRQALNLISRRFSFEAKRQVAA